MVAKILPVIKVYSLRFNREAAEGDICAHTPFF
jgi:hypothetical protein